MFIRPLLAAGWSDAKTLDMVVLERDCSSFSQGTLQHISQCLFPVFKKGSNTMAGPEMLAGVSGPLAFLPAGGSLLHSIAGAVVLDQLALQHGPG